MSTGDGDFGSSLLMSHGDGDFDSSPRGIGRAEEEKGKVG